MRRDGVKFEYAGRDAFDRLIERVTNDKINLVYVWDMGFFGYFCDYWAFTNGLPQYDEKTTARDSNGRILDECWSAIYTSDGALLNFKITKRSTGNTHDGYGIGKMHTCEFRGLALMLGNMHLEDVRAALGISAPTKEEELLQILEYTAQEYGNITGEEYFDVRYLRNIFTCGGAAKRMYLKMRYGEVAGAAKKYHKEHNFSQEAEYYFRSRKLLLGGMCILNPRFEGKLLHRRPEKPIFKYDVNGLYTWAANEAGEIGNFTPTTIEEWQRNKHDKTKCYVIVFDHLLMFRKGGMPRIFQNPMEKSDSPQDVIEIKPPQEWACFSELLEELLNYYDLEEWNIVQVLVAERKPDKAIKEYNSHVLAKKDSGRSSGNKVEYTIAKVLLNALLGKFSQITAYRTVRAYFDIDNDCVELDKGALVDNWEKRHFDYMRGAYIYVLARVKVMRDLRQLFTAKLRACNSFEYHYFYTDTDSIITDIQFPSEWISKTETGKYKIEEVCQDFGVIAKKTYFSRSVEGVPKLTAAGLPKTAFLKQLYAALGNNPTSDEIFDYLANGDERYVETRVRVRGGGGIVLQKYVIGKIAVLEDW